MYIIVVDTFFYTTTSKQVAFSKFNELCPHHRDVLLIRFGGGRRSARVAEQHGFDKPAIWYDRAKEDGGE